MISQISVGYQRGSFDTEHNGIIGGDIGIVGSHHELAEMNARPGSSTLNKILGVMNKRDTPRPCSKPVGISRSPELIIISNQEIMENKN